jgi:hypothetical protein
VGKLIAVLLVVALGAGLWFAGEQHRQNCIDDDKTSCSVLPWDDGEAKAGPKGRAGKDRPKRKPNPNKIPSNQTLTTFKDSKAGYSIRYPKGWERRDAKRSVTFRKNANYVRVVSVSAKQPPKRSQVKKALDKLSKRPGIEVDAGKVKSTNIDGAKGLKVTFVIKAKRGKPTEGRSVSLKVRRYLFGDNGKRAIVDLVTPKGIDNARPYRKVIKSFRWL